MSTSVFYIFYIHLDNEQRKLFNDRATADSTT